MACVLLSIAIVPAPGVSTAQIAIDGRSVRFVLRLPLDEIDLVLRLDRDLDGQVSQGELDASRDRLSAYLAKHLRVTADGTSLTPTLGRLAVRRDAGAPPSVEAEVECAASRAIGTIAIASDLLTEVSASHTTQAQIRIANRDEAFVFQRGATFERQVAPDRRTASILVAAGAVMIALLVLARRRTAALTLAALAAATIAQADVIMSATGLNATLKTMERLTREMEREASAEPRAIFQLGLEADALASLMNQEVESHGMQERELLDLALSRTKELGVGIAYNREKKKFFYDGAAFVEYLKDAPRGAHAAAAEFKLLSYQFYQSTGTDLAATIAAADAKQRFLARHPNFSENAELRLYLAVDYRDVSRTFRDGGDAANADKYRRLARAECERIVRAYPRTDQADAAQQILRTLR